MHGRRATGFAALARHHEFHRARRAVAGDPRDRVRETAFGRKGASRERGVHGLHAPVVGRAELQGRQGLGEAAVRVAERHQAARAARQRVRADDLRAARRDADADVLGEPLCRRAVVARRGPRERRAGAGDLPGEATRRAWHSTMGTGRERS